MWSTFFSLNKKLNCSRSAVHRLTIDSSLSLLHRTNQSLKCPIIVKDTTIIQVQDALAVTPHLHPEAFSPFCSGV